MGFYFTIKIILPGITLHPNLQILSTVNKETRQLHRKTLTIGKFNYQVPSTILQTRMRSMAFQSN